MYSRNEATLPRKGGDVNNPTQKASGTQQAPPAHGASRAPVTEAVPSVSSGATK